MKVCVAEYVYLSSLNDPIKNLFSSNLLVIYLLCCIVGNEIRSDE